MKTHRTQLPYAAASGAALLALLAHQNAAQACGCFAPPDPSVPVVQAGERILFSVEKGVVTAHIQIQFAGNAAEFGWLLPLPSVPTLELGTDELFTQLTNTTQPKYRLNRVYEGNCAFDPSRRSFAAGSPGFAADASEAGGNGNGPLVFEESIGPYDYAVLKADNKDEMLEWMADNRYFVPAGTEDVVGPYIRPGAYFLALKLKSGQSSGDLQPVVLHYPSDLPMIPIVLTSVAAQPDMGIQVWMLGNARAIPRNYYHTVINDAAIDWFSSGQNYNDVIIAATREAPERRTFVTEYAGSSDVMKNVLNPPERFGTITDLAAQPNARFFVRYLLAHQYPFTSQMAAILGRYIPVPADAATQGLSPPEFYQRYAYCEDFSACDEWDVSVDYKPTQMAMEIEERIVEPTLAAGKLFDTYPKLTRLYTTLSPEDMKRDPVFSFNAELPDYSNVHEATLTYHCGVFGTSDQGKTEATLKTDTGLIVEFRDGTGEDRPEGPIAFDSGPASLRLEVLGEEGPPVVQVNNAPKVRRVLVGSGCSLAPDRAAADGALGTLLLALAVALGLRRRA